MVDNAVDCFTMVCLRRANLDAFWSRESSTVSHQLSRIRTDHREVLRAVAMKIPIDAMNDASCILEACS